MSGDRVKEGDQVALQVMGRVIGVFDEGHGSYIRVELEKRDFREPRLLYLDYDEFIASPVSGQPKVV